MNKKQWEAAIRLQSREFTASEDDYERYKTVPRMFYEQPAEEDKPAALLDNLRFLTEAGFHGVDCFWRMCGFAIFGGYK